MYGTVRGSISFVANQRHSGVDPSGNERFQVLDHYRQKAPIIFEIVVELTLVPFPRSILLSVREAVPRRHFALVVSCVHRQRDYSRDDAAGEATLGEPASPALMEAGIHHESFVMDSPPRL